MICKFKNNLKELRNEFNIEQKELAIFLNVSKSTISGWEVGRNQPSYEMLMNIANYFNVSTDELLGYEECNETLMTTATNSQRGSNNVIGAIVNGSNNGNVTTKINIKK